jgi:hypothetical protein
MVRALQGCESSRIESGQRSRVCRRGFLDGDMYLVFGFWSSGGTIDSSQYAWGSSDLHASGKIVAGKQSEIAGLHSEYL